MVKRNNKGQFVKGSKSMGGRPKGSFAIQKYVASISNNLEDYIDILDKLVRNTETKLPDKISCLKELLDRGAGRTTQAIHQTGDLSITVGLPEDIDDNI